MRTELDLETNVAYVVGFGLCPPATAVLPELPPTCGDIERFPLGLPLGERFLICAENVAEF